MSAKSVYQAGGIAPWRAERVTLCRFLGRKASVQHCCGFSLAQVDAYCRLTNVSYLCGSVFQFVGLVSVHSMAETKAFIRFVRRKVFDAGFGPFGVIEARLVLGLVIDLQE